MSYVHDIVPELERIGGMLPDQGAQIIRQAVVELRQLRRERQEIAARLEEAHVIIRMAADKAARIHPTHEVHHGG